MSRIFDELDDESAPSTGEEIGAAVSAAMEGIAESNRALAERLSDAIGKAMSTAVERPVDVIQPERKEVKQWRFDVHRDAEGRMTHVVAIAA